MKCDQCQTEVPEEELREHAGRRLCEDCTMDVLSAPRTCDPWAVYSAKNTNLQGVQLTDLQQKMLTLVGSQGPLSEERICAELGIGLEQFRSEFAALRHMELMRACKTQEGGIRYARF